MMLVVFDITPLLKVLSEQITSALHTSIYVKSTIDGPGPTARHAPGLHQSPDCASQCSCINVLLLYILGGIASPICSLIYMPT